MTQLIPKNARCLFTELSPDDIRAARLRLARFQEPSAERQINDLRCRLDYLPPAMRSDCLKAIAQLTVVRMKTV